MDKHNTLTDGRLKQEVRRELAKLRAIAREQRRGLVWKALLVGLLAGASSALFHVAVGAIIRVRREWTLSLPEGLGGSFWGLALVTMAAVVIAAWMVKRLAPEASGSGIPHVKEVLMGARHLLWKRVLAVKFFGGLLALGSGMALGREGPTVQMGAAMAQMTAEKLKTNDDQTHDLLCAGAGAGLAATFNAPIAGICFILEELHVRISTGCFFAACIACLSADILVRCIVGQVSYFPGVVAATPPVSALPAWIAVGIAGGLVGVAFNKGLLATLRLTGGFGWRGTLVSAALVGLAVAWIAHRNLSLVGEGGDLASGLLTVVPSLGTIAAFFAVRYVLTMWCYSTKVPGGFFSPQLALGALTGAAVWTAWSHFAGDACPAPVYFVAAGMAAHFASAIRAPLTGIVLLVEMTAEYRLIVPLMAASLVAMGVAELLKDKPIYDALTERDLHAAESVANEARS